MNVLIVEDYKELAKEIIDFLSKNGYLCKWVSNCEDALEEINVNTYDAMLLDLGLPDGDGFQVLENYHGFVSEPLPDEVPRKVFYKYGLPRNLLLSSQESVLMSCLKK